MQRIVAEYEVVTPLMLGGANAAPEFRLASYVNVIRWWWRFFALGRYGDADKAGFFEAVLFGWHYGPFGRKRVTFRLTDLVDGLPEPWRGRDFDVRTGTDDRGNTVYRPGSWLSSWSGINYLSAQAFTPDKAAGDYRAPARVSSFAVEAILFEDPGSELPYGGSVSSSRFASIASIYRDRFSTYRERRLEEDWCTAQSLLLDAMYAIGLAGGLGSRQRRGFGSLSIRHFSASLAAFRQDAKRYEIPASLQSYAVALRRLFAEGARYADLPPYTALSKQVGMTIPRLGVGPLDARWILNRIGHLFQCYRSFGEKDSKTGQYFHRYRAGEQEKEKADPAGRGGKPSYEPRFLSDHDNFYADVVRGNAAENTDADGHLTRAPHRSVFGLPQLYGKAATVGWDVPDENDQVHAEGRRASPLFFHIHRLADGTVHALLYVAPARFLPSSAAIAVKVRHGRRELHLRTTSAEMVVDGLRLPDFSLASGFLRFAKEPPPEVGRG